MFLTYENKKSEREILDGAKKAALKSLSGKGSANKLIQGDNLAILKTLLEDYKLGGKVDLIYIDPPFATNVHFKMSEGRANTISMANGDDVAYSDT
ncbi:MAG: site-specific DNA-methyltransferase, partial [Nitrospinae bacterium]|nr:site-specific DNA-methyltransferase [Nitrospinota bacterium]